MAGSPWLLTFVLCCAANEELTCWPADDAKVSQGSPLYAHLLRQAAEAKQRRAAEVGQLKTSAQIAAYQDQRRALFRRLLGEFPQRGPLNGRVVQTRDGDGYRLENVIYESQPGHHVTANLYLPKTQPPFPGVIVPCGHSHTGKGAEAYQRVSILLAKHGIAALCYDPIGQGERYQMYGRGIEHIENPASRPNSKKLLADIPGQPHFDSVEEHTLIGVGSILLGTSTAKFRIWDGMRSLDYLASRPEIDARRLGCTGNSGGGTLTAYLMALDDRIVCAAPACYLTTFERLLETSGPQDAEQNLFAQLALGLDEADYVLMRAPRPTRLLAGTRDATFDIRGTWDIFRESKRIYTRLEKSEAIDLVESDAPHGFTIQLREGAVQWMKRWLLGRDEALAEAEFPVWKLDELQCTPRGQVMLLDGERSVFDLHRATDQQFAQRRAAFWKDAPAEAARQKIRDVLGSALGGGANEASRVREVGSVVRDGYRIDKLLIERTGHLAIPVLRFMPAGKPSDDVTLYVSDKGKAAAAAPGGELEALVRQGRQVWAVDLCGYGETEGRRAREWSRGLFGPNGQEFFLAYLLGQSLVGLRTKELLTVAQTVSANSASTTPFRLHLLADGSAGIPALHAAALEPQRFVSTKTRRTLASWASVLGTPLPNRHLTDVVHGVLESYDLPDLVTLIDRARLTQESPVDAAGQMLDAKP